MCIRDRNDAIYASADQPFDISFSGALSSGGAEELTVSQLQTLESSMYLELSAAVEAGFNVGGSGASGGVEVRARMERGLTSSNGFTNTNTVGYELMDDDRIDRFDLQRGRDQVFGTPIFFLDTDPGSATKTSCPYEGGYQIDQPLLTFSNGEVRDSIVDVPADEEATATFFIDVCNDSDVDRTYYLMVDRSTNTEGAEIKSYGENLSSGVEGAMIPNVPANGCLMSAPVTVRMDNTSILDYEDIDLVLYVHPDCQPVTDPIESRITLTARFTGPTNTSDVLDENTQLRLSPNPTNGQFSVFTKAIAEAGTLRIMNANGQVVHEELVTPFSEQIRVSQSNLQKGLYLVSVQQQQQVQTTKLLIQ